MLLDKYLGNYELTRYQLAKKTNISEGTWQHVNDRDAYRWTVAQISELAKAVGKRPGTVLNEVLAMQQSEGQKSRQ